MTNVVQQHNKMRKKQLKVKYQVNLLKTRPEPEKPKKTLNSIFISDIKTRVTKETIIKHQKGDNLHEILQISNNFEVISMTNLNKKHNDPNNDDGGTKPNKSITNPY